MLAFLSLCVLFTTAACTGSSSSASSPAILGHAVLPFRRCYDDVTQRYFWGNMRRRNSCDVCTCSEGNKVTCSKLRCPERTCTFGTLYTYPGDCCPVCTRGCTDTAPTNDGTFYPVGYFSREGAPCTQCYCDFAGAISCQQVTCPQQTCPGGLEPVVRPGTCCGVCPPITCTDDAGTTHRLGHIRPTSRCQWCRCNVNGKITCQKHQCPQLFCPRGGQPVTPEGSCCPRCPVPTCTDGAGVQQKMGRLFTHHANPCTVCHCGFSGISCFRRSCSPFVGFMCHKTHVPAGRCCAVCGAAPAGVAAKVVPAGDGEGPAGDGEGPAGDGKGHVGAGGSGPGPASTGPTGDATGPGPDSTGPGGDAPGPDNTGPGPDSTGPGPDNTGPGPDSTGPGPDNTGPGSDSTGPGPDSTGVGTGMGPDGPGMGPDSTGAGIGMGPDGTGMGPDSTGPGSDSTGPGPDSTGPEGGAPGPGTGNFGGPAPGDPRQGMPFPAGSGHDNRKIDDGTGMGQGSDPGFCDLC